MSEQPKLSVLQRVLLTITREEDEEKLLEIYDSMHLPICFQVSFVVCCLIKILGCKIVYSFILISIHGIQNNTICLCFTDILPTDGHKLGTCISVSRDSLILKNASFQLILKAVSIIKFAA